MAESEETNVIDSMEDHESMLLEHFDELIECWGDVHPDHPSKDPRAIKLVTEGKLAAQRAKAHLEAGDLNRMMDELSDLVQLENEENDGYYEGLITYYLGSEFTRRIAELIAAEMFEEAEVSKKDFGAN